MIISDEALAEVWATIEREVIKNIVRDAAYISDDPAEVAHFVECCAEQLRQHRQQYLAGTALWIERELGRPALH
jgi:hypothetical protein